MTEPTGSVTTWIAALKAGDSLAAQPIWERYYLRLVGLARRKLASSRRGVNDADDVVQNALLSFFLGVANHRFLQLHDRDNLWRLLVVITARKVLDQQAHDRAQRRGGQVQVRSLSEPLDSDSSDAGIEQIIGEEPTPEFAAEVAEECQRLLERLGDPSLREVAVWKMEGFTNQEIASKMEVSLRTVARKLEAIRVVWETS